MTDAHALTLNLGGRWHNGYGVAACPVCQPQRRRDQNALTLADGRNGRLLLNCKKSGCAFLDILAAAGVEPDAYSPPDPHEMAARERAAEAEAERRKEQARQIWLGAAPIEGTLGERYLRNRGITAALPGSLRFHGNCFHGATAKRYPALVSMIVADDFPVGVHRTYLAEPGHKADIEPAKAMLGPVAGGAVRLSDGDGALVVAEGIENGLSLLCGLVEPSARVWAALSASGVRSLDLPPEPGTLILAADNDEPGRAAAYELGCRAHALGWKVRELPSPGEGRDYNDRLREVAQ